MLHSPASGRPDSASSFVVSPRETNSSSLSASRELDSYTNGHSCRLLWIDDEVSQSDPEVRFLESLGFRVDCAVTGNGGLFLARGNSYGGILLDLKLPDLPGLSILATLRAERIMTPVLVVTGFADLESARVAGRFGASGFTAKPLFIDDLEIAVKRLVETPDRMSVGGDTSENTDDELRAGFTVLARLLEHLHHFTRTESISETLRRSDKVSDAFHAIASELVRALSNSSLPMIAFLASCKALRITATVEIEESLRTRASHSEELILEALAKPGLIDPRVVAAIESIRCGAAQHKRPTIEAIADGNRLSAPHLGRMIKDETGFEFTEWRTAFILRPAVAALLETNHDIKQIACNRLGFKHLSQFDHEFHRFFGLTPTEFRKFRR